MATTDEYVPEPPRHRETPLEKLIRKTKREPYVPLGVLCTVVILGFGLRALKRGDRNMSQTMMRYRVYAQGATVLAIGVGLVIYPKEPKDQKHK